MSHHRAGKRSVSNLSQGSEPGFSRPEFAKAVTQRLASFVHELPGCRTQVFGDIYAVKDAAHDDLLKIKHDVTEFYHQSGIAQQIARSKLFQNLTLGVIFAHTVWLGVDADHNQAETLASSSVQFQIADNIFVVFFTAEILIRFSAFQNKWNAFRDRWFKFDSFLVSLSIIETWIAPDGIPIDMAVPRMLRLARLTRLLRLLKIFPELVVLLKGMVAAMRSVSSTLILLVIFMYIFAILCNQHARGNEVLEQYFGTIGQCFWTLLLHGTLLDSIGMVITEIKDASPFLAAVLLIFVLIGNFTILNMLIGVLCEVVNAMSAGEKERATVKYARDSFLEVLMELDSNGNGEISQEEFSSFISHPDVGPALDELGVDLENLQTLASEIFSSHHDVEEQSLSKSCIQFHENKKRSEKKLSFAIVLEQILTLRSSNNTTVKDIVNLRRFIRQSTNTTHKYMMQLATMIQKQSGLVTSTLRHNYRKQGVHKGRIQSGVFEEYFQSIVQDVDQGSLAKHATPSEFHPVELSSGSEGGSLPKQIQRQPSIAGEGEIIEQMALPQLDFSEGTSSNQPSKPAAKGIHSPSVVVNSVAADQTPHAQQILTEVRSLSDQLQSMMHLIQELNGRQQEFNGQQQELNGRVAAIESHLQCHGIAGSESRTESTAEQNNPAWV